jgi:hypothetical protein
MVTIRCPHCDEPVEIDPEEVVDGEFECPECFETIENLDELAELDSEEAADAEDDVVDLDLALDGDLDGRFGRDRD